MPRKFGRYEVVRELGKGAMGIVYLGKDPVIGRLVALKTIRVVGEDDAEEREFGERFLREAQAAGILSHPNIVTVHDVGEDPDTHISFIAMEYVEGKNLKQLVAEKTSLTYERIADIIGQVAEALDYAHRKGIVHRDVKPANVIITPEGAVKITDFGIAKIEKSNLTSEGQFLGTPNYMSPEQVTGDTVDGRSDLFSLGVVLYELLTRKKPFSGENLTSISYKIVHEPFAPPDTFDADIPPEFGSVLTTALAKNPADRYQRGRDFALALYEFKARQEEREMLRDLGQMVAAAENLGGVAAIDSPPSRPVTPPPSGERPIPLFAAAAAPVAPSAASGTVETSFELGAASVSPSAPKSPDGAVVDYSAPDWTLESDGMETKEKKETKDGMGAKDTREPVKEESVPSPSAAAHEGSDSRSGRAVPGRMSPVSPPGEALDGVTERLDLSKHAAFLAPAAPPKPAAPPAVPGPPPPPPTPPEVPAAPAATVIMAPGSIPVPAPRPVAPPAPPAPPAAPPVPPPAPRAPVSLQGPSELTEKIPTGTPIPPPRVVISPSKGPSAPPPPVPVPPPPAAPTPPAGLRTAAVPAPPAPPVPVAPKAAPAPAPSAPKPAEPAGATGAAGVAGGAGAAKDRTAASAMVNLRRDVNPKFVAMILGIVTVVALVIVGLLMGRQHSIKPVAPVDESMVKETEDRRRLMAEGTKLSAEGKYEEALARFRELARRSPESTAARSAVASTEALLASRQAQEKRAQEVAAHVAAAREAEAVPDDGRVIAEADAALALDPANAAAQELKAAAEARQASKSAAQKKKEAAATAAAKKAKPTATPRPAAVPVQQPRASEPSAPVPTPGTMTLRISFQSPVPRGLLMVGVGNSIVFRRDFDFGKSAAGGLVDGSVTVPSGQRLVKVWLIATDRSLKPYRATELVLPGGETKSLAIALDSSQNLTFGLR